MELLSIGKISGTHHLKGAVKFISNIEDLTILENNKVIVENSDGNQGILSVKGISHLVENKWVIEFEEITNKNEANKLKNSFIKVRRDILGIAEDEYLLNDLLNMKAIDNEDGKELGIIVDIFETAAHDILVVDSKEWEIMVPDVEEFVKKIDFENRIIYLSVLDGMIDMKNKNKNLVQDDGLEEE